MKNTQTLLLFSVFLLACNTPLNDKKEKQLHFRTSIPSLLYFKNIRSTAYYVEEDGKNRMERYKLKKFPNSDQRPIVYPIIVNNWLEDEAYIFLDPNSFSGGFSSPLEWRIKKKNKFEILKLKEDSREEHLNVAIQIYNALLNKNQIDIKNRAGNFISTYETFADRNSYIISIRDYLKLTDSK